MAEKKKYIDPLKQFEATMRGYNVALHFLIENDWEFSLVNGCKNDFGIKVTLPDKIRGYCALNLNDHSETIETDDGSSLGSIISVYCDAVDFAFDTLYNIYQDKQREAENFKNNFMSVGAVETKEWW